MDWTPKQLVITPEIKKRIVAKQIAYQKVLDRYANEVEASMWGGTQQLTIVQPKESSDELNRPAN